MSAVQVMTAVIRENSGTGAARAVRRAGHVPAVVYGAGKEPQHVSLDPKEVTKGINRRGFYASLVELEIAGKKQQVLPKSVQFHPVTDVPLHVDLMRVDEKTKIVVSVPVRLLNQEKCRGLKIGGTLNVVRHAVEVLCPATTIPEEFSIDIAELKIGEAVKSSAIPLPAGVSYTIRDRDFTIATIAAPRGAGKGGEEEA